MAIVDVRSSEAALTRGPGRRRFDALLDAHALGTLRRPQVTTLQINVGKRCNQACLHCHVEAGPNRPEVMTQATAEQLMSLLERTPSIDTVDITGGAPELCPSFDYLMETATELGRHVLVRHNLTVMFEPGREDLAERFAAHRVEVVASLPCYSERNVDIQRGKGVFSKSIAALRRLNALGYGAEGSGLALNLVYNPGGAFLPPAQAALEADYRARLHDDFGVAFTGLLTITNMPIKRFAHQLLRDGEYDAYMQLLTESFNPGTVPGLMCRSLVSIGWTGRLYDCDFNQMLDLDAGSAIAGGAPTIWELDSFDALADTPVATGAHCLGCTAGSGSSCGGALA